MSMRDFFKGGRDRDNDRWREQWRDDRYPQRYSSGSNPRSADNRSAGTRQNYGSQRGPQFYGQSGRADWAGQGDPSRQQRSRDERGWNDSHTNRNESYHGGFYAGETGRESMYRT